MRQQFLVHVGFPPCGLCNSGDIDRTLEAAQSHNGHQRWKLERADLSCDEVKSPETEVARRR